MARRSRAPKFEPTNNEVRSIILRYFYDRNANTTSGMGKRGSAIKISDVKAQLKADHGLTQQQVQSNLTYLISQGWIEERAVSKQVVARGGTLIPSTTTFYQITASGIDKIEGPGEFTMPRFHGIKIEATGENIITLGDGNVVNARFKDLGKGLLDLREIIVASNLPEGEKMEAAADIETIQAQLAKPAPNAGVIAAAWASLRAAATVEGATQLVHHVGTLLGPLLK